MICVPMHLVNTVSIEQAVATAAAQPVESDPGKGFWDGRIDGRTGYPTETRHGIRSHGGALVRVRFEATSYCPSGPCGKEMEVIRIG